MPIKFESMITRRMLRRNPDVFFVFGDNEVRKGLGGQAKEMRGEPNAIGVRTKRLPENSPQAFWSEEQKNLHILMVEEDFAIVEQRLAEGRVVVFPEAGLGTGLAQLPSRAPSVHAHIQQRIMRFSTFFGTITRNLR